MVPLATGANALDEDRACRVEVRDLLGETDDAAVTDLDDSTDRLAFAGAFRDRPGCNDTVDTGEFHLSAGTIKDQFSRGSRVRFELVLECVGHDSRSEDCCRNKLPDHRNPELDQVVTDIEYLAAKTDANIGGTKGPNPQPGLLGDLPGLNRAGNGDPIRFFRAARNAPPPPLHCRSGSRQDRLRPTVYSGVPRVFGR